MKRNNESWEDYKHNNAGFDKIRRIKRILGRVPLEEDGDVAPTPTGHPALVRTPREVHMQHDHRRLPLSAQTSMLHHLPGAIADSTKEFAKREWNDIKSGDPLTIASYVPFAGPVARLARGPKAVGRALDVASDVKKSSTFLKGTKTGEAISKGGQVAAVTTKGAERASGEDIVPHPKEFAKSALEKKKNKSK